MESMHDTMMALLLLVVALGAIIGSLLVNPVITVYLVVLLTFLNGVVLVKLTFKPKG